MTTKSSSNLRNSLSEKGSTCDQGWNFGLRSKAQAREQFIAENSRSRAGALHDESRTALCALAARFLFYLAWRPMIPIS